MRKSNSIFKTAFVSESGAQLANNDYFAFVELDDYACYVLASGITDFESSEAAQSAVEHLILSFEEKPSMAKTTLLQYMQETNERLLSSRSKQRLKASVIMLVTDYEKCRYVTAGNVRLRIYRQGRLMWKSADMSLANDMIEKGETDTPLDRHEERNNLYAYLGKPDSFRPDVSKVYKLLDADIILLYSRGLWENVDEQEIDEIVENATDEPSETVNTLEEVLLSRQPKDLNCYTITAIFVNKAYRDPERERKRLRYIKIACIVLVILLIIAIIFYIFSRIHQQKVQEFNSAMTETQQYMDSGSYVRAQDSCKKAIELAQDLGRDREEELLRSDLMLLDSVVEANDWFNNRHYNSAYETYLKAMRLSDANDVKMRDYIQTQLDRIEAQLNVTQFMNLGDDLFRNEDYDAAEGMYTKAADRASTIHDAEGRDKAFDAIEQIYDKRAALRKDAEQKMDDKKKLAMSDLMKKGDDLLAAGDIEGAQKAYLDARNLSDNIADRMATSDALAKVSEARDKKELEERQSEEGIAKANEEIEQIEKQGDEALAAGDYLSARMYYVTAIDRYKATFNEPKVAIVTEKYETARAKFAENENSKKLAADTEQKARDFYADKNYAEATATAKQAKDMYEALGMKSKVDEMDILLQQIATDNAIANSL